MASVGAAAPVAAASSAPSAYLGKALADIGRGFAEWRIFTMLALSEMQRRYRRSVIGQFWMTLSMAVSIVAMGLLWGMIFKTGVRNTLPFIGVGLMVWNLLSGLILETSTAFIAAESYLKQIRVSKTAVINQTILRLLIAFAHNVVLVPIILLIFPPASTSGFLLVPLGLVIYVVNGLWLGLLLGTLCVRFRDLPQIIASVMQILFFLTPIIWNPDSVGPAAATVVALNPMASLVSILREPLLGITPHLHDYLMALAVTIVGYAIAIPFFARFRARIVYWL